MSSNQNACDGGAGILARHEPFTCKITHIPLKRIFDIGFSIFILVVFSPLFLLIAFFIKCSGGKVIFSQERIGRGGVPFHCYKFRTMYPDAQKRLQDILKSDPAKLQEWEQNHKLRNDPRITPIGHFLRRTSLDELPQFWNVLKGDLSVVGPRPVVHEEIVRHFGERAEKIFVIRPGITGLWQVSGRSDVSYQKRIELDETYVKRRSFNLDLKIIFLTIPSMFSKKGAY